MKIVCLQFAPELGKTEKNIERANDILKQLDAHDVDLLVLPELAFTGYNFPSLASIQPYLESTSAGISTQWAIRTARQLNCIVSVGYPEAASASEEPLAVVEKVQGAEDTFKLSSTNAVVPNMKGPLNYNSTVTVSPSGEILAHYRKSFLYYTDVSWARPGSGFYSGRVHLPMFYEGSEREEVPEEQDADDGKIIMANGICMDLNPENFTAPWQGYEFANHIITSNASLAILNMAWSSHDLTPSDLIPGSEQSRAPDLQTLSYWVERLGPVVKRADKGVIMVMANRCGIEGEACYAGTSAVMRLGRGSVQLYGVLGKGEEGLLMVDTSEKAQYVLTHRSRE